MHDEKYKTIVQHYESCFRQFGDSHRGVDWPNQQDADTRYRIMLEVVSERKAEAVSLLDFGCGVSHLLEYINRSGYEGIEYSGLDMSPEFVKASREKFPQNAYYELDILYDATALPTFDYIVMNGVFTEKRDLTFDEMLDYFMRLTTVVFQKCNKGMAFNVMSKQVDWERQDLFHLPLDDLAWFLTRNVSRNFIIRNDYKLYEYTTYVYK
ncbi:MAG: class I SAM-dependent methyltransferase [Candidatus Hydrogenedentes bacterium]|nr:class I SAM-dependent methyltransferase [Candidatus Hydrogenedentota bacterium]